jgi:hypothetical protein
VPSCLCARIFKFDCAADVQILSHKGAKAQSVLGNGAVSDREQGRRQGERMARILLAMIAEEPEAVKRVMSGFEGGESNYYCAAIIVISALLSL